MTEATENKKRSREETSEPQSAKKTRLCEEAFPYVRDLYLAHAFAFSTLKTWSTVHMLVSEDTAARRHTCISDFLEQYVCPLREYALATTEQLESLFVRYEATLDLWKVALMIHDFTRFGEIPLDAPWLLNVALFLKRQFWFDAKADACRTRFLVEETKEQQAIRVPRELQSFCMDVHVDLITIPAWTKPFSAEVLAVCQEVYSVMVGKLRSDFLYQGGIPALFFGIEEPHKEAIAMEVQRKQAAKVLLDFIQERFIEATDLDNDNIVMQQLPLDRDVLQQNIRKALYAEAKAHDVFPTNEQIFEFTGVYLSLMEHVRDIHRAHRALDAAMANAYRTHDEEEDEDDSKEAKDDA